RRVVAGEIYDVAFRCMCGQLSTAPSLPQGFGIGPVLHSVAGQHDVATTLINGEGAIVIGQPAVDRRRYERGEVPAPPTPRRQLLNDDGLAAILRFTRSVFADILPELEQRHRRATPQR